MADKLQNNVNNKLEPFWQAQSEMRKGYADGAIGVMVSGFIWLIAAFTAYQYSPKNAVWALFIGGIFIHPISIAIYKLIGLSGAHSKDNPLGKLAMEGTIFMIMCIPLAFGLSFQQTEWFFQAMLLIIGGRYLTFATIYGKNIFWLLGATLAISAYLLYSFKMQSIGSSLTGSCIEISFGLFMFLKFRRAKLESREHN